MHRTLQCDVYSKDNNNITTWHHHTKRHNSEDVTTKHIRPYKYLILDRFQIFVLFFADNKSFNLLRLSLIKQCKGQ